MSNKTDCFFVGSNILDIKERLLLYKIRQTPRDSLSYRLFNLNFVRYQNKYYTKRDLFNYFFYDLIGNEDNVGPVGMRNILNSAISYLGNYLYKRDLSIGYINEFNSQKNELAKNLKQNNIRCIAIPTTFYTESYPIVEIIQFIKKYSNTVKIILGGPFILDLIETTPGEKLQEEFEHIGADFYIYSTEGEEALEELVKAVKYNDSYEKIDNLYYWDGSKYKFTSRKIEDNDFEENVIDWSLFEEKSYGFINVRTSKSCSFSCSFCTERKLGGTYRKADLGVIEKILDDINNLGIKTRLTFLDDTFNIPVDRFKNILRMMIKKNYKFKWDSFFRCQYADREMVELMKESGCESVLLGIESGNQEVLNNMNKNVKVEQYYEGLSLLNEYEIINTASFITGFPGETYETFLDTKNFIEEGKPTFYRANAWNCHPLSPIYQDKEKFNIKGVYENWSHNTMDSVTAHNLAEELFLNVENSIWVTNLDFDATFTNQLLYRGLSLDQIKQFYINYNMALRDKLVNSGNRDISTEVVDGLKSACIMNR